MRKSGPELVGLTGLQEGLRVWYRRFHCLVLLRAEARIQQNRRVAVSTELEARRLASATVNLRLAAVRRLAYEAADSGLLSPETGCWDSPGKGHEADQCETRQLATS
jgi:hypothetical protein